MTPSCFIIVGYNNVRLYDVDKLRRMARQLHDSQLVLVVESATPQDWQAADHVIQARLGKPNSSLPKVADELARLGLTPVGILPFSDKGVPLGARLAAHYALPGAAPEAAWAGLDKPRFRQLEASTTPPTGYQPLACRQVATLSAFQAAVIEFGGRAFVKPTGEGNSRGCQQVPSLDACPGVWGALSPYHDSGLMVEPLIEAAREFSWDYVAGHSWLTEKFTTHGDFRAEYQQIVPAYLTESESAALHQGGRFMQALVSPTNGAYHNELFLHAQGVSAVETNMRPAGMHIWDLARLSFDRFDPWATWLAWAREGIHNETPLSLRGYSGIRMLRARHSGELRTLPDMDALAAEQGIQLYEGHYSKECGAQVSERVTDNAGFIGHIVLHARDYHTLRQQLDNLADAIERRIDITQPVSTP